MRFAEKGRWSALCGLRKQTVLSGLGGSEEAYTRSLRTVSGQAVSNSVIRYKPACACCLCIKCVQSVLGSANRRVPTRDRESRVLMRCVWG